MLYYNWCDYERKFAVKTQINAEIAVNVHKDCAFRIFYITASNAP